VLLNLDSPKKKPESAMSFSKLPTIKNFRTEGSEEAVTEPSLDHLTPAGTMRKQLKKFRRMESSYEIQLGTESRLKGLGIEIDKS
jgi:hypothetical protein